MNFIVSIIIRTLAVLITALLLPGVKIEGNNFFTALLVAVVLGFLNTVIKPILVILTIPITFLTLGLFMIVINAALILFTDYLVKDFKVESFGWAVLFSIILWFVNSILESFRSKEKNEED